MKCVTLITLWMAAHQQHQAQNIGGGFWVGETTTIKYFSVDSSGNAEAVKTTVYTINCGCCTKYDNKPNKHDTI